MMTDPFFVYFSFVAIAENGEGGLSPMAEENECETEEEETREEETEEEEAMEEIIKEKDDKEEDEEETDEERKEMLNRLDGVVSNVEW